MGNYFAKFDPAPDETAGAPVAPQASAAVAPAQSGNYFAKFDPAPPQESTPKSVAKPSPDKFTPKPMGAAPAPSGNMGQAMQQASQPPNGWSAFEQLPFVGGAVKMGHEFANNVGKAGQEAGKSLQGIGRGDITQASQQAGAIPAGLGTGFLGGVEALGAGAYEAERQNPVMPWLKGAPSYNQMVGGKPVSSRVEESLQNVFPDQQGTFQAAKTIGGLGIPVKGLTAAEGLATEAFLASSAGKKIISQLSKASPAAQSMANMAGGAAKGAGGGALAGAVFGAGENAKEGQPLEKNLGENMATGSTLGAGFGAVTAKPGGKKVSDVKKPEVPTGPEITPESHRIEKTPIPMTGPRPDTARGGAPYAEQIQRTEDVRQSKPVSEIYPTRKPIEAIPVVEPKKRVTTQVRGKVVEPKPEPVDVEVVGKNEAPAQSQAPTFAETQRDFNPATPGEEPRAAISPEVQALHDELGIEPAKENVDELPAKNRHEMRQRVPISDLKEAEGQGNQTRYTKDYDPTNTTIRVVKHVPSNRLHVAKPHSEDGYAELGRWVDKGSANKGSKGASYVSEAAKDLESGTNMASRLRSGNAEGLKEHYDTLPKHQQEVIDIIESNNKDAAEKTLGMTDSQFEKLRGVVFKGYSPSALPGTDALLRHIFKTSEAGGKPMHEVAQDMLHGAVEKDRRIGEGVKEVLGAEDDFRTIKRGEAEHDDHGLFDRLKGQIAKEARLTHGETFEGKSDQLHDALRYETPEKILKGHADWTEGERKAAAIAKLIKQETKQMIKDVLERHYTHGQAVDPRYERALERVYQRQYGEVYRGEPDAAASGLDQFFDNLANSWFRNVASFGEQVSLHPTQLGSSVSGVDNVAMAYNHFLTNPKVREYVHGHRRLTQDFRDAMADRERQEAADRGETPPKQLKDIPFGRFNNEIMLLAGMRKKALELYKDKADAKLKELASDPKGFDQNHAQQMIEQGIQDMNDATAGGTYGVNRTQLENSPVLKHYASISGYHHLMYRFHKNQVQDIAEGLTHKDADGKWAPDGAKAFNATKKLLTITGTTIALGGRAPMQGWQEDGLALAFGPTFVYNLEKVMDSANLMAAPSKINPNLGMQLANHMEYSLLNFAFNLPTVGVETALKKIWHLKDDPSVENVTDAVGHLMMLFGSTSAPVGIGMSQWLKTAHAGYNLVTKDRKISKIYPGGRKLSEEVNLGSALHDAFIAGDSTHKINAEHQQRIKQLFKQYGRSFGRHERMPRMEHDYPTR